MTVWYILSFLFMQTSFGLQGQHILQQSSMCQKDIPAGDFGFYFDGEEIFYVDPESKEVRFRLPEMEQFFTFEAQSALHLLAVCKENLDVLIQWTERKSGPTVPPHVEVYPIQPVQLGKPNTLICSANGLFPSVVNITWSKNGIPVEEGIQTTDFYPRKEFTFERFSYLTFIPDEEDIYSCTVEHPAFDRPDTVFWPYSSGLGVHFQWRSEEKSSTNTR
ncbi:HLA class II histocompatibility antigen, DP alpha 1 chain-like [Protopterus annectens]|uniref:HLA class II histocompatibility antigen, DP alpha 1 chain-like n=1 Tax=Protopterus annectens TaxID=7888 RepID=UPI001CFB59EE|nr:HLA class II histocompatibility antigen, DP alpha 1 chain-like [Protopterus annectens]